MESCEYEAIPQNLSQSDEFSKKSWKPLCRQVLVCTGIWTFYLMPGLFTGVPPVFVAHTRKEANSTDAVTPEMASWLSAAICYGALPWVFILPMLAYSFGRKVPFFLLSINAVASYIVLYLSQNVFQVLICEIMASMTVASHSTVAVMIIVEYTSPRYRGVFLTLKSAIMYWGVWLANAIGTFFHWRNIGVLGLGSCIFCTSAIFWPESPYWLASKGKLKECAASHRYLKGVDSESEKELESMIKRYKDMNTPELQSTRIKLGYILRKLKDEISKREVYRPILVSISLLALYECSGKMVCTMYILDIVKELTQNEWTAYVTMLILDGVTVLGMYLGCVASKFLMRRTLFLGGTLIGVIFLYVICAYLYLIKLNVINNSNLVLIMLLVIYSISISVGPMLMIFTVYGEIIPIGFSHEACILGGFFESCFGAIMIKCAPSLFTALGFHGSFFLYAVSSSLILLILYKYLPETKDRTLQEISDWFKGNTNLKQAESKFLK